MKNVVFVLLALAITVVSAAPVDDFNTLKECLDDNNIKPEELGKLLEEKHPKAHCFVACTLEKDGLLKNGELNKAEMVKELVSLTTKINEAGFNKMYDSCMLEAIGVTDMCAVSNSFIHCIHDELVKAGI